MRASGIIHQQICQLKWHLLACLGLIMVLPVEEAIVNLKAGDGFFSSNLTFPAVMFGPLLAGLIACANVQSDLNEKLYIFWRSKPANVKLLITLKFLIGLIASLLVIACPVVFTFLSNIIWNEEGIERVFFKYYMPLPILIAIMTYSLCFASNVVVRKTARAWLIGMLMVGFLLVLPFMLPLNYKDYMSDIIFWTWGPYLLIMLVAPAAAFVFALFAAQHDWHLRTNLKGLLWAGAGLAFVLLMLFSSQVANIKVLQEKEIEYFPGRRTLDNAGSRLILQGRSYIDIDKDSISLSNIIEGPDYGIAYQPPRVEGYHVETYPRYGQLYKNVGDDVYFFTIDAYYRESKIVRAYKNIYEHIYEKTYLKSYKHTDKSWLPVFELDISECLTGDLPRVAMRFIDNRLIACVNNSCVMVDATDPGELKLIDKKLDVLKKRRPFTYKDRKKEFAIPLIPIEEIGVEERIRLSIDMNYRFYNYRCEIYNSSIVDIHDGKFAFFFIEHGDVARYDVTRWDDEKIYCRFSGARPFTILESVAGAPRPYDDKFVKNGKFYCYDDHTLMVFDIRSNHRIRKLGHFVRMDYDIRDMAVLEDGNILLCMRWYPEDFGVINRLNVEKYYLYLLKNPE
jgi:hypothetical protein